MKHTWGWFVGGLAAIVGSEFWGWAGLIGVSLIAVGLVKTLRDHRTA